MSEKDPFILDRPTGRPLRARDALVCVFVAAIVLLVLQGQSIRGAGEKMDAGIERTAVLAVGHPAGWLADQVGLDDDVDQLTASLSPDEALSGEGGFDDTTAPGRAQPKGAVAPITADAFDPAGLGEKPVLVPKLDTLLVTGDSLAQPLDVELARRLASQGVRTVRDVHLGTGISKTELLDWGRQSVSQVREHKPNAIVFFLGANEGFPFGSAQCCGPAWAAQYATRARRMMQTFRRSGAARVYWLTLPTPRSAARQRIARSVNAAILAAAQPYRAQVRVLDMTRVFTPGGRYRAAMDVGGRKTIVREPDGIHLNQAGAGVAAGIVIARLKADFQSLR
ncbi:MAG: GDSL-type esterase/lipase family protein [Solirubrobacteraceae bacterium]